MELKERMDQARPGPGEDTHISNYTPKPRVWGGDGGSKMPRGNQTIVGRAVPGWGEAHMAAIHGGLNISQIPGSELYRH